MKLKIKILLVIIVFKIVVLVAYMFQVFVYLRKTKKSVGMVDRNLIPNLNFVKISSTRIYKIISLKKSHNH